MSALLLGLCMAVAACSPSSQHIPRYDDIEGLKRVTATLSPWNDGSPDRSRDGRTYGEDQSDRHLFVRWIKRYYENEELFQHDKDYVPFAVPATVAEAIMEQRQYEAEQAQRATERAAREAEGDRIVALARKQEGERQKAAEAVEQDKIAEAAKVVAAEQSRTDAETEARQQADLQCRDRRSEAEHKASLDPTDPQAAIARVRSSMRCESDGSPS